MSFIPDGFSYRLVAAGERPSLKAPSFEVDGMLSAEFRSGDPAKLEILQNLGNALIMNGRTWQRDPAEMQTLAKLFGDLNAKVKQEGLGK